MFDIGFSELLLVGVMGLIILGPERLPQAARTVGLLIGRVRRTMSGIQQEIEQEVRNQEIREKLKDPLRTFVNDDESSIAQNEHLHEHDEPIAHEHDTQLDPDVIAEQIKTMHSHHPKPTHDIEK